MAWNQAGVTPRAGHVAAKKRALPSWGYVALVASILIIGGGIYFFGLADKEVEMPQEAVKPVATAPQHVVEPKGTKKAAPKAVAEAAPVVNSPTNAVDAFVAFTNCPETVVKGKGFRLVKNTHKKLFHTIADNYISRIINTRPGHAVIGTFTYERFPEQFKKALETPITIDPSDTEEEVAMKNAVIATRKELKDAMDRGEDIGQIMRESEEELRRLYRYRSNLNQALAGAMRERKFSAKDMQDYVDTANKMLKDNGLEPLKHPQFWVHQLEVEEAEARKGK